MKEALPLRCHLVTIGTIGEAFIPSEVEKGESQASSGSRACLITENIHVLVDFLTTRLGKTENLVK